MKSAVLPIILAVFCVTQASSAANAQASKPATLLLQIKNLRPTRDSLQNAEVYSDGKIVLESNQVFGTGKPPVLVTRTFHVNPTEEDGSLFFNLNTVSGSSHFVSKTTPMDDCFFMFGNFEATIADNEGKMIVVESSGCQGQSIHLPDQIKPYLMNIWYSLTLLGTAEETK